MKSLNESRGFQSTDRTPRTVEKILGNQLLVTNGCKLGLDPKTKMNKNRIPVKYII